MAALYEYRSTSFQRQHRLQLIEDKFGSGMQYTNTPLPEGFVKSLVNFDMHDDGGALTPRLGLRSKEILTPQSVTAGTVRGNEQIVAAREQNITHKTMPQFFVNTGLTGSSIQNIHKGKLTMLSGTNVLNTNGYPISAEYYNQVDYPDAAYVLPQNAEIHNIPLETTNTLTKHVGTYGWAQRYYFFDPALKKLVHSEWDETTSAFKYTVEEAKSITTNTAVTWGYNMLAENPYAFENKWSASGGIIDFDGILPYSANGQLNLTPVTNEQLDFRLYYSVPEGIRYHIVWEWRSTATDSWTVLQAKDVQFATLLDLHVPFSPPDAALIMRVSAYGYTQKDADWVRNTFTDATIAVGFNFNKTEYGNTVNANNKTYSIPHASGMTYWKNRLVVWGVPEDPTLLFASDVNDPTYFPYPNNCETFDEPVKYAVPFMDYLLVFTSTQLHMLTLTQDGLGWTTQRLQNNLTIADWDIHLIQVVKNMVFFRSGNYYYMIVPKAGSSGGELALATISKPLYYLFDNFKENVEEILYEVYDYRGPLTLLHYYNYLDFEDIHNVYVFQTDRAEYINFCLLYNIASRSWRIYTFGSQAIRTPYKADATQRGTLCSLSSAMVGEQEVATPLLFQFSTVREDWYIPKHHTIDTIDQVLAVQHTFRNWQHMDMGYREHSSNFKKRYRELQFVINNISNQALDFHSDFYIDGEQRKNRYIYEVVHDIDPASPNYGLITVEKKLSDPVTAPATTALGDSETDFTAWRLDNSRFPDVAFWKVRLPVSGKGYTPRFSFTSRNESIYELLNVSFIYRALGSR